MEPNMNLNTPFTSNLLQKSLVCWLYLIDKMSHFFINKLATLKKKHIFLHRVMPSLIKSYHLAIEHKLMEPEIPEPLLENINTIINLEEEFAPALKVVDLVSSFCSQLSQNNINSSISMKKIVTEILSTYEFKNNDRNCIQFNENNDFDCLVPEFFIKTTLTTLLRFIFSHFKELTENSFSIRIDNRDDKHSLHIKIISKDTEGNYDHWFQNSLNVSPGEVSSGINLCRLGLLYYNGDITYQATTGQSLEIIISIEK